MKSLFLHGYGLSIKVKNTRMVFSQGIDPFSDKRDQVPLATHISPYLIEMQQPTIILLALLVECRLNYQHITMQLH